MSLQSVHSRLKSPMFRLAVRRTALVGTPEDVSRAAARYMTECGEDMEGVEVVVTPAKGRGNFVFNVRSTCPPPSSSAP